MNHTAAKVLQPKTLWLSLKLAMVESGDCNLSTKQLTNCYSCMPTGGVFSESSPTYFVTFLDVPLFTFPAYAFLKICVDWGIMLHPSMSFRRIRCAMYTQAIKIISP